MLLKEVGLAERKHEKIGGYSGGMRQRVAVARTLLRLPPVIIVDEPTVGLDPRERIRFRNLLAQKASEGVKVRVLYDWVGCWATPASFWRPLKASGAEVRALAAPIPRLKP